nr:uncharacterized protein LOC131273992 isoform X1 [Dasypus novemcinctus]XP_058134769.1 uncharacterized protein LOC131273992 isoform X1 [Dasypus novemcinctus]XP_058134770.1 uncharacterized protein LOC131273992 isoform X1 [Dasypus novemcinctus]
MGNRGSRSTGKKQKGVCVGSPRDIPPDSPLGRMLRHWTDSDWTKGKDKKKMIQYCCCIWTKESILLPGVFWPKYGSDEDWLCADLVLYVNGKTPFSKEESDYAMCWLKGKGATFYPMKAENPGSKTKLAETKAAETKAVETKAWDPLSNLPPPHVHPPLPGKGSLDMEGPIEPIVNPWELENQAGSTAAPVTTHQQLRKELEECKKDIHSFPFARASEEKRVQEQNSIQPLYTLREVPMGPGEIGYVNAPVTSTEVRNFKEEMKSLMEDPVGLAEQVDQFLGPRLYTWPELMSILNILFTGEERGMVWRAAMKEWDRQHPPGQGVMATEQKFPNTDPNWDHNDLGDRTQMKDFRDLIIQGIKLAIPKSQNLKKAFEVAQEKDEMPSAYLQRLRDQVRKYSGMDPDDPVAQGMLKVSYVKGSWPDIQKKIQKKEGWMDKPLEELLRESQKVFVRREKEKQKQKAKVVISKVDQMVRKRLEMGQGGNRQREDKDSTWSYLDKGTRRMQGSAGCSDWEDGSFQKGMPEFNERDSGNSPHEF